MSGVSSHRAGATPRYASLTAATGDTSAAQEASGDAQAAQATSGTPGAGNVARLAQRFSDMGAAPRRQESSQATSGSPGGAKVGPLIQLFNQTGVTQRGQESISTSSSQAGSSLLSQSRAQFVPGTHPRSPPLTLKPGTDSMFERTTSSCRFNDVHFHQSNYVQRGRDAAGLIGMMDKIGCKRTVLMPIPTSFMVPMHAQQPGAFARHPQGCCTEYYYVPAAMKKVLADTGKPISMAQIKTIKGGLFVESAVDSYAADVVRAAKAEHRDRFDPMMTGFHLGDIRDVEALLRKLTHEPGIFTGIGEITIHKEVVEELFEGKGQANLTDRSAAVKGLIDAAGAIGMPVVLHCDVNSLERQERSLPGQPTTTTDTAHFNNLKKFFKDDSVKNTTVIWAHAGGIGRYVDPPADYPGALNDLLRECPKLHLDISWDVVAMKMSASPEKAQEWSSFLTEHSDRVLFGTDSLAPADHTVWSSTVDQHKPLLESLPADKRSEVTIENYERLIVGARDKVRTFEQYVLPQIQDALNDPGQSSETPINAEFIRQVISTTYSALANLPLTSDQANHRITLDPQGQVSKSSDSTRLRTQFDWKSNQKPPLAERFRSDRALIEQVLRENSGLSTAYAPSARSSGASAVYLPLQLEDTQPT